MRDALGRGRAQYTAWTGIPELRAAIADKLRVENGVAYDPDGEIIVTAGAQEALIPEKLWKASAVRESHSLADALDLARQACVHPCIVAGRIRHETGNWRLLSGLISEAGSVKHCFSNQQAA